MAIGQTNGNSGAVDLTQGVKVTANCVGTECYANVYTTAKVDVTNFTKLSTFVNVIRMYNNSSGTILGLASQQTNGNGLSDFSAICDIAMKVFTVTGEQIVKLDITSKTGEYYVRFFASSDRISQHHAVWFE